MVKGPGNSHAASSDGYTRQELVTSGSDVTKAGWRTPAVSKQAWTGAHYTMEPFPVPQFYDSVFLRRRQGTP